jgi:antirestriction protein ArdC
MKGYTVFNAEQIDGLPGHFYATVPPLTNEIRRWCQDHDQGESASDQLEPNP